MLKTERDKKLIPDQQMTLTLKLLIMFTAHLAIILLIDDFCVFLFTFLGKVHQITRFNTISLI